MSQAAVRLNIKGRQSRCHRLSDNQCLAIRCDDCAVREGQFLSDDPAVAIRLDQDHLCLFEGFAGMQVKAKVAYIGSTECISHHVIAVVAG
ncbi:uncharacterized protein METZ01_LOCUS320988, partial [marine metagenome]